MRGSEFRWAEVRVGLFVALVGIILFAMVVYLGLAGAPFTRHADLNINLPDASGLAAGSPVEMGGVVIGELREISLPDIATGKVPVKISVQSDALERIGPSSTAFVSSHALVGMRFIGVTPRQPDEPPLKEGATIRAIPSREMDTLIDEALATMLDVRELIEDLRGVTGPLARIGAALDSRTGTLGKLVYDDALYSNLADTSVKLNEAAAMLGSGDGAFAALLSDEKLANDLRATARGLASTVQRVQSGKGVLGRLTADEASAQRVDRTLANLESVTTQLTDAQGTLGALIGDDALLVRMNGLLNEMDSLVSDVRRNPSRYLKLEAF